MCGRFALFTSNDRLAELFDAIPPDVPDRPRWNIGPMSTVLGLVDVPLTLAPFKWGLVPSWAKDPTIGKRMFNARCETVATKPSFRSAFRHRPMAVVADGFFEWDQNKQPYFFTRSDGNPLALAGLWETWQGLRTCTIITAEASDDVAEVHKRMPIILEAETVTPWLKGHGADLGPAPRGTLVRRPVDSRVGNIRNNDPTLIEEKP